MLNDAAQIAGLLPDLVIDGPWRNREVTLHMSESSAWCCAMQTWRAIFTTLFFILWVIITLIGPHSYLRCPVVPGSAILAIKNSFASRVVATLGRIGVPSGQF